MTTIITKELLLESTLPSRATRMMRILNCLDITTLEQAAEYFKPLKRSKPWIYGWGLCCSNVLMEVLEEHRVPYIYYQDQVKPALFFAINKDHPAYYWE